MMENSFVIKIREQSHGELGPRFKTFDDEIRFRRLSMKPGPQTIWEWPFLKGSKQPKPSLIELMRLRKLSKVECSRHLTRMNLPFLPLKLQLMLRLIPQAQTLVFILRMKQYPSPLPPLFPPPTFPIFVLLMISLPLLPCLLIPALSRYVTLSPFSLKLLQKFLRL